MKSVFKKRASRAIIAAILIIILPASILAHHPSQIDLLTQKKKAMALPPRTLIRHANAGTSSPRRTITVKRGESLSRIFSRLHLHHSTMQKILKLPHAENILSDLRPGQKLYFQITQTNKSRKLLEIKFPMNETSTLYITADGNDFKSKLVNKKYEMSVQYASGIVTHSFSKAARKAGFTNKMIAQFHAIFGGNVNFTKDLRPGDTFSALYKEYYTDGKKDHPGNIIATMLTNHGKTFEAVRYTDPDDKTGYYTPEGKGIERLFLRAPLRYKRISSRFNLNRFNPVLKIYRPHMGTDYAAGRGTPIRTVGSGRIIFMGRKGGYGKVIIVKHDSKYTSLYAHMAHYADNLGRKSRVHRGQIIGYVGTTGTSTGPHLHFEIHVNRKARDFLKLKFPGGKSVAKKFLGDFLVQAHNLMSQLHLRNQTAYANAKQSAHK